MNSINNLFDKIFVINLKRRPDRLEHFDSQAKKYGINYEIIEAFDGDTINGDFEIFGKKIIPSGEYKGLDNYMKSCLGATISHYQVLKKSIENSYKKIMVFEDDVLFNDDFEKSLIDGVSNLPENWDFLYLSGTAVDFEKINTSISKLKSSYCLHSYCLSSNIFNKLILEIEEKIFSFPVDVIYSHNLKNNNSYITIPFLTKQYSNFSDIQKINVNYNFSH